MLVLDWMTSEVITVKPDTSVMKASRIMKEKKVRRMPVVDEDNVIIGIVSDRDIKKASPSSATSLEIHELHYLLSELKVKEIMTKSPKCAKKTHSVESVALLMIQNCFGGVPVVDENEKLCGIITDTDIFKAFISITGADKRGPQLAFKIEKDQGILKKILDFLKSIDVNVLSVLTTQEDTKSNTQNVYIRLNPIPLKMETAVNARIKEKFPHQLLYWEVSNKSK